MLEHWESGTVQNIYFDVCRDVQMCEDGIVLMLAIKSGCSTRETRAGMIGRVSTAGSNQEHVQLVADVPMSYLAI